MSRWHPHPLTKRGRIRGGRGLAETMARDLAGCVVSPWFMDWSTTSARRRWSQISGVAMRRQEPHPRPWDGPQIGSFLGIFRDVDSGKLAGSYIDASGMSIADAIAEIEREMFVHDDGQEPATSVDLRSHDDGLVSSNNAETSAIVDK